MSARPYTLGRSQSSKARGWPSRPRPGGSFSTEYPVARPGARRASGRAGCAVARLPQPVDAANVVGMVQRRQHTSASRSKRANRSGSDVKAAGSTFSAASRSSLVVGIEIMRAHRWGEGFQRRPFGCGVGSQFPHGSRFTKPPYDPGRSDFPSPVLTLACPPEAFPEAARFKRWHTYTPATTGLPLGSSPLRGQRAPGSVSGRPLGPPSAQSPFARRGCYPRPSGVPHRFDQRYPVFVAPTGSCARPKPSRRFRSPYTTGLCRLRPAPAG